MHIQSKVYCSHSWSSTTGGLQRAVLRWEWRVNSAERGNFPWKCSRELYNSWVKTHRSGPQTPCRRLWHSLSSSYERPNGQIVVICATRASPSRYGGLFWFTGCFGHSSCEWKYNNNKKGTSSNKHAAQNTEPHGNLKIFYHSVVKLKLLKFSSGLYWIHLFLFPV